MKYVKRKIGYYKNIRQYLHGSVSIESGAIYRLLSYGLRAIFVSDTVYTISTVYNSAVASSSICFADTACNCQTLLFALQLTLDTFRFFSVLPANTMLHVTYMLVVIFYSTITHVLCNSYIIEWEITTNIYVTCNIMFAGLLTIHSQCVHFCSSPTNSIIIVPLFSSFKPDTFLLARGIPYMLSDNRSCRT